MKILFIFTILVCSLTSLPIYGQESGWVDSSGYKQQILKTGSIQQVAYSQNGDKLYSVSSDSLWRVHYWDVMTGKLLRIKTIDKSPYSIIYSVMVANDGNTYTVCGLQTDNKCHAMIYSIQTDSLFYDVVLSITTTSEVKECSGVFDTALGILWLFYNSYNENGFPPSGTRYGGMLEYLLKEGKSELISSDGGAVKRWSVAVGVNSTAWIGYFHKIRLSSNGNTTENTGWMKAFLKFDSTKIQKEVQFDIIGFHTRTGIYASSYFPVITSNGKHYFLIDHMTMSHWSLAPYGAVSSIILPFTPISIAVAPTNNHLLINSGRQILIYNITANIITDSLNLPFDCTTVAISPNSKSGIFGSSNGMLRTIDLQYSKPNIQNDFYADRMKMYVDSAITFSMISGKTIARFKWDFGDGFTDSTSTAIHRFTSAGNFSVKLYLTDTSGVTDTISKQDYIFILPNLIPAFSASPRFGSAPLEVQFKDESQGSIISWNWNFGDMRKDTIQNPSHVYGGKRYYNVSLTISDGLTQSTHSKPLYINTDTIPLHLIEVKKKWISNAVNLHNSTADGNWTNIENAFSKGILGNDGKLYLYWHECYTSSTRSTNIQVITYHPQQSISSPDSLLNSWKHIKTYSPGRAEPWYKCEGTYTQSGYQLIHYKNHILTSFNGWSTPIIATPSILYFTNGRSFKPPGWTHDFDGAFLPDGTDIFLFRNKYSSSLQFFNKDTIPIARDSLFGDVMRPLASPDSQYITVFANPYLGTGDSSRWLVQRTYSTDGTIVSEKHIEKSNAIRLTDVADIGWGDFLICGRVDTKDSLGNTVQLGYLAKIGSDGRLTWEYTTPTWQNFAKFQRLGSEYFAVWGTPQKGFNHGFLAIRTDGSVISDNRLAGASSNFSPSDFIKGNGTDEVWFIGSEYISDQGQRAVVYLCHNPVSSITGIKEIPAMVTKNISAEVFPIPATDKINVRISIPRRCHVRLSLISVLGVECFRSVQEANAGIDEYTIPTDELPVGMYYICIKTDDETQVVSAIVVR